MVKSIQKQANQQAEKGAEMINPFTLQKHIKKIQEGVLRPLYTMYPEQEQTKYDWLLVLTGRAIAKNQAFIEEVCRSSLVAAVFKIVKLLGGAEQLTEDDFRRFTSYVNDGGIPAMVKMLLAAKKEDTFITELQRLPLDIRQNAQLMLQKSSELHLDFITGFFKETYGPVNKVPAKLKENLQKSTEFIDRLAILAQQNLKKIT